MKNIENRIIAIGGGEIEEKATIIIDQEIVRAANKKSPKSGSFRNQQHLTKSSMYQQNISN